MATQEFGYLVRVSPAGGLDLEAIAARLKAVTQGPTAWGPDWDTVRGDIAALLAELRIRQQTNNSRAYEIAREFDALPADAQPGAFQDLAYRLSQAVINAPDHPDYGRVCEDLEQAEAMVEALRTALRRITEEASHGRAAFADTIHKIAQGALNRAAVVGAPERDLQK